MSDIYGFDPNNVFAMPPAPEFPVPQPQYPPITSAEPPAPPRPPDATGMTMPAPPSSPYAPHSLIQQAPGALADYFKTTSLGQLLGMGPTGEAAGGPVPGGGAAGDLSLLPGLPKTGMMSPGNIGTIPGLAPGMPHMGEKPGGPMPTGPLPTGGAQPAFPGITGMPSTIPGAPGGGGVPGAENVPMPPVKSKPSLGEAPGGSAASSVSKTTEKAPASGDASKRILDALRSIQQPAKPDVVKPVSPALPRPTQIQGVGGLVQLLQQLGATPGAGTNAPISLAQILK